MIYQNQDQLDADLAYWQRLLRLQDWNVTAEVSAKPEDFKGRTSAYICTHTNSRHASIKIKHDSLQRTDALPVDRDQENSLVHELLHISVNEITDPVEDADPELYKRLRVPEERHVWSVATALVDLRRAAA